MASTKPEGLALVMRVRECGTFVVSPLGRYPDAPGPIGIAPRRALPDETTAEELGELLVASLAKSRRFKHPSRKAGRELAQWDEGSQRVAEEYLPQESLTLGELHEHYRRVQVRHLTHQDWWRVRAYAPSPGGMEEVWRRGAGATERGADAPLEDQIGLLALYRQGRGERTGADRAKTAARQLRELGLRPPEEAFAQGTFRLVAGTCGICERPAGSWLEGEAGGASG